VASVHKQKEALAEVQGNAPVLQGETQDMPPGLAVLSEKMKMIPWDRNLLQHSRAAEAHQGTRGVGQLKNCLVPYDLL
jgi:hypothetical protein